MTNRNSKADSGTSASIEQNPMLSAALSTREANLLIASFMGYDDYKQTGAVIKDASMKFVLTYDLNWSELMPVIEKIESIKGNPNHSYGDYYVKLSQCSCRIHKLHNKPVAEANGYTKIEAAFEAVTEFIMWYNLQGVSEGSR
jgi:hypothetical protein